MIVLLRGAPGVGKSTVANQLHHITDCEIIETDHIRHMFKWCNWSDLDQYRQAIDAAVCAAMQKDGKTEEDLVLIVDTFYSIACDETLRKLQEAGHDVLIVSLVAFCDILEERIEQRENGFKDLKVAHDLNWGIREHRVLDEICINTSSFEPLTVACMIRGILKEAYDLCI